MAAKSQPIDRKSATYNRLESGMEINPQQNPQSYSDSKFNLESFFPGFRFRDSESSFGGLGFYFYYFFPTKIIRILFST